MYFFSILSNTTNRQPSSIAFVTGHYAPSREGKENSDGKWEYHVLPFVLSLVGEADDISTSLLPGKLLLQNYSDFMVPPSQISDGPSQIESLVTLSTDSDQRRLLGQPCHILLVLHATAVI